MLPLEQLREDLKEIRYYYARKDVFDSAVKTLGINEMLAKADKYNQAARTAPPTLLDLLFLNFNSTSLYRFPIADIIPKH